MSIYKRGKVYWYKFMWNGELIRESTKQGNDRKARNMESAHRAALANGLVGIRERKLTPSLSEFLKNDFLHLGRQSMPGNPSRSVTTSKDVTCSPSRHSVVCISAN